VNGAVFTPQATPPAAGSKTADPLILKVQVLLDRRSFSPGAIDGLAGQNYRHALLAFEAAHGLPRSQRLTAAVFNDLAADKAPVVATYVISPQDVKGPFDPDVGENFVKMSKQKHLGYSSPKEMLAERFHMAQSLLAALNPGADFGRAGVRILVADPHPPPLAEAASLRVDKRTEMVTALGPDGKAYAAFPATVGSTERPSPKGRFKVLGVAQNPDYVYDPRKLTWGPRSHGKLHIPPGPNGPVGVVWIALSAKDYGIHGTPQPQLIGKTASHGCVRLTNWDAEELSHAVKPGTPVRFVS
jgi:lipoprotein-anchoring transpeptidase ErfK/SrfK